jgi:hypothetical protein
VYDSDQLASTCVRAIRNNATLCLRQLSYEESALTSHHFANYDDDVAAEGSVLESHKLLSCVTM